jgi:acetyl esterase/lipase
MRVFRRLLLISIELSQAELDSPMTCLFLFSSHRNLPPVYIQACGQDPFRDTAFIYEGLLRSAGSPTKVDVYPGLPCGFWSAFPQLKATSKWVGDIVTGAAWLLEQGRNSEANHIYEGC